MLAVLTPIDYGVFGLLLAIWLAIAGYFSARQRDTNEFFLASRTLGSLPLGMSLAAIFVSLLGFTWLPGQAYDHGWRTWIIVLALWIALPVLVFVAIPIYRGLGVVSLYEYLEQRFSPAVRLAASSLFVAWRMLWVIVAIYLPCAAIRMAAGWAAPTWLIVLAIGSLATLGVFLGGQRGSAWSGLYKGLAMFGGVAVTMIAAWTSLQGAPPRVVEIARGLGRMEPVELNFGWTDPWTLWGALPFWVLTVLTFFVADQLCSAEVSRGQDRESGPHGLPHLCAGAEHTSAGADLRRHMFAGLLLRPSERDATRMGDKHRRPDATARPWTRPAAAPGGRQSRSRHDV